MNKKETVIAAIPKLKFKVTPADIASATGLSFFEANNLLNTVATETRGILEVTTSGQIAYKFYPGFENSYILSKFQEITFKIIKHSLKIGFFLLKISFGIILILSVVLVLIGLYILLSSRSDNNNNRDDFGDRFLSFVIIRDFIDYLFIWNYQNPSYGYGQNYNQNYNQGQNQNFLFSCFSFLFGDGNPNLDLDAKKWQLIAEYIRSKNGAVTANELAPFTGADPNNENLVLPVLAYFEGIPQVSASGNIIYLFPKMTITSKYAANLKHSDYLEETKWEFSKADITGVIILALFNFFGTWFLWLHSFQNILLYTFRPVLALLCVYGTLFVVIPVLRYFGIMILNQGIEKRNSQRKNYFNLIKNPTELLQLKLTEASSASLKTQDLSKENIVYTTERDNLEQSIDN